MFESPRKILNQRSDGKGEYEWPSIVLLLREPVLPDAEQAMEMARKVWGAVGPTELLGAVGPHSFAIRIAPLTFALHAFGQPYEINALLRLSAIQQQCWDRHRAWMSVDLPGRDVKILRHFGQLADAYKTLMFFANKHWSPNCLALYFPSEGAVLPNRGGLIDSIRLARQDGIDLDFMKPAKPNTVN